MRAPSLLAQCLPGLLPHERGSHGTSTVPERETTLPSPAVEVLPSKTVHASKYTGENIDLPGVAMIKGRLSVTDVMGFVGPEVISSKPEGYLKSWDSSIDLVNVLKHEIRDGQLTFRGKRVLELGCSYGLAGILACMKGASTVHFQDQSAETVRCSTIPNVVGSVEQAREVQSRQTESPITPSRHTVAPSLHFYAGEWEELHTVLSVVRNNDGCEVVTTTGMMMNLSLCEEDLMDGCSSSQDGSIVGGHELSCRRSRKLSGSRAWERASEAAADQGEGGYDVILMSEIPYTLTALKKLYTLLKKCVRPPYGVAYLATKRNYVGFMNNVGGGKHLRNLVDEEGVFGVHLVKEMPDRDVWKFFLK